MFVLKDKTKTTKLSEVDQPIQSEQQNTHNAQERSLNLLLDRLARFFVKNDDVNTPIAVSTAPLKIGMVIIFLFFGIFGLWSVIAPIEGAVFASGKVIVASYRKAIQHLEGGIVENIFVNEGDRVYEGQPLVKIRSAQAEANKELLQMQWYELLATRERIDVELHEQDEIEFTQEILQNLNSRIIEDQISLFKTRKELMSSQMEILKHRIRQLENEEGGVNGQRIAFEEQLSLTQEEIVLVQKLLDQGNVQKNRLLNLKKQKANLEGSVASYNASLAKIQQGISEAELEVVHLKNKFYNDITSTKKDVDQEISNLVEKIKIADDILDRLTIIAPQDGIIANLRIHTIGGIIPPSSVIMEIIPVQDNLIIDAKIMSKDIGAILQSKKYITQIDSFSEYECDVRVRLSAYSARRVPMLKGKIMYLSADTLIDDISAPQYYTMKISILNSELKKIPHLKLYPGMPAEIFIPTQSRTLLSYLATPITSSFRKAFKES